MSTLTRIAVSVFAGLLAVGCALQGGVKTGTTATSTQTKPSGEQQIDTVETHYSDGTVQERYSAYRDKRGNAVCHGSYTMWGEQGHKLLEYDCRHGKRHGVYRSYYPSGKMEVEAEYVDDQPHGKQVWFYESGEPQREEHFVNGVKHGPVILFYENGKTKYEGSYENGQPHGTFDRYFPNGDHEATGEYDHGKLIREETEF